MAFQFGGYQSSGGLSWLDELQRRNQQTQFVNTAQRQPMTFGFGSQQPQPQQDNRIYNPAPQQDISTFVQNHPDALTSITGVKDAFNIDLYNQDPLGFMLKHYGTEQTAKLFERGQMTAYGVKGQAPTVHFVANDRFFNDYMNYVGQQEGSPYSWGAGGEGGYGVEGYEPPKQPDPSTDYGAGPLDMGGKTLGDITKSAYDNNPKGLLGFILAKGTQNKYNTITKGKSQSNTAVINLKTPMSMGILGGLGW